MATEFNLWDETFAANIDLQSCQYTFVKFKSGGVTICGTSGEAALGVLQNKPASNENAVVRMVGKSKIQVATTVAINALMTTGHSGQALPVTASSGQYVIAQAAEVATASDKASVLVRGTPFRHQ